MSSFRRTSFPARSTGRGGFTLVELLVVIAIIAILASVAFGPIMGGLKTAQHNAAMQNSRGLAILCFQYSIDNGSYPCAGPQGSNTSEGIAQTLLQGKYTTDPTIFFENAPGKQKYTGNGDGGLFTDFSAANIAWDFMADSGAASGGSDTGLTSSASDLLPVVWSSGNTPVTPPTTGGSGFNLQLTSNNVFALDGVAVTYHSNSAQFMRANPQGVVQNFIAQAYNDTTQYVDIAP